MSFNTVTGAHYVQLVNIPTNLGYGYKQTYSGYVRTSNDSFLFYSSVAIQGSDSENVDTTKEIDANWSVKLAQVPCDSEGNILLVTYWFSPFEASDGSQRMRIMFLCSEQPTHRLVLATGEVIDIASEGDYIREMLLSYTVLER